jgi:hypothetical protein
LRLVGFSKPLRCCLIGAEVMAVQLEHLAAVAASPQVDLQVLPFSAGVAAEHLMPFTLLTFEDNPSLLYSDGPRGGRLYDSAQTVAWAVDNCDRPRANALSLDGSLAMVTSLLKELRA